jgi:hypothetical protein
VTGASLDSKLINASAKSSSSPSDQNVSKGELTYGRGSASGGVGDLFSNDMSEEQGNTNVNG